MLTHRRVASPNQALFVHATCSLDTLSPPRGFSSFMCSCPVLLHPFHMWARSMCHLLRVSAFTAFTAATRGKYQHHPHFADKETETQRKEVEYPKCTFTVVTD